MHDDMTCGHCSSFNRSLSKEKFVQFKSFFKIPIVSMNKVKVQFTLKNRKSGSDPQKGLTIKFKEITNFEYITIPVSDYASFLLIMNL